MHLGIQKRQRKSKSSVQRVKRGVEHSKTGSKVVNSDSSAWEGNLKSKNCTQTSGFHRSDSGGWGEIIVSKQFHFPFS